jgi:hypothetical protein
MLDLRPTVLGCGAEDTAFARTPQKKKEDRFASGPANRLGRQPANLGRSTSLSKLLRDLHALLIAHSTFGD